MGYASAIKSALFKLILVLLAIALASGIFGSYASCFVAEALSTQRFSARPNSDNGNDVLGGEKTRINWEFQANESAPITGFTLVFPEGTTFNEEDASVTLMDDSGTTPGENDHLKRVPIQTVYSIDNLDFSAKFLNEVSADAYLEIRVQNVIFPQNGGELMFKASVNLANGDIVEVRDLLQINVKSFSFADKLAKDLSEQDWVKAWNSNDFLRLFFNPPVLVSSFPVVMQGFFTALALVLCAYPCAIPLGLLLALMRMSKLRLIRAIGSIYVNIIRGTPFFLQLYVAFFGLPLAGVQIPSFILGFIMLFLNSGAYLCEIFRAGIQSIPDGQTEASRSLGMSSFQTMFFIIIPQTIRRVIPTMTNEFILLYKDTSLLAAVGVMEVVMYAKTIVASTGSITPYIVAAFFYLIITIPLASLVGVLERKLDVSKAANNQVNVLDENDISVNVKDESDIDGSIAPSIALGQTQVTLQEDKNLQNDGAKNG
ncbi:MAG: amino acid ABC transporter permease [Coriobacteriales bacterium]|nr:amino acid ABC transporter permease [Coriobacteriales bacterium]